MSLEEGELERTLGFVEAMTLGGGTMIGAGIFILPGIAAESAGPASSISYAVAGFVALLAALSLSELATAMPIAGGATTTSTARSAGSSGPSSAGACGRG